MLVIRFTPCGFYGAQVLPWHPLHMVYWFLSTLNSKYKMAFHQIFMLLQDPNVQVVSQSAKRNVWHHIFVIIETQQNIIHSAVLATTCNTRLHIRYALCSNQVITAYAMKSYCMTDLCVTTCTNYKNERYVRVGLITHSYCSSSKMVSLTSGNSNLQYLQFFTHHSCFLLCPLYLVSGAAVLLGASSHQICTHSMSSQHQLVLWTSTLNCCSS
jgi:hypothetical protein